MLIRNTDLWDLRGSETSPRHCRTATAANHLRSDYALELTLLIVVLGIMVLLATAPSFETVILNLFFLPVAIAGLYLGRYLAGVTALLCVLIRTDHDDLRSA